MIPLIPTLALAFVSFISSVFVILRILLPILPPHPLSRRVAPSEFGLPNFRSLSPADKSHVWLASCDLIALAFFVWQAISESLGGMSDYDAAHDPLSAVRLWIAMTLRQTCLLVVASLTLLHVRMGRPVAFGSKHWMLWAPTFVIAATSTTLAGVLSATGVRSFFVGLVAYLSTIAVISSVSFICLVGTLVVIKRNLSALHDIRNPWPPANEVEEKPRPSFATEEIDALKDGSSWITSRASSRCDSVSAFSFSTRQTHYSAAQYSASARNLLQHPATASHPSIPAKSSFWFDPATPFNGRDSPVPPVPPLPAPYRPASPTSISLNDDPDPFRRHAPSPHDQRPRNGSQSSWLTEASVSQATLTAWSFPTAHEDLPPTVSTPNLHSELLPSTAVSRPMTPAMSSAQVLGGYGYDPEAIHARKPSVSTLTSGALDISVLRVVGWLITIWVPLALGYPYLLMVHANGNFTSSTVPILLALSVTLSSPLLALNIILRSPLPIPTGLFETYRDPPSAVMRAPSPQSLPPPSIKFSHEYKRSGSASVTVVEGRRSGDVWVSNGDAVDGKSKFSRAMGLLQPNPKLSVLPPSSDDVQDGELTPPLPMQTETITTSLPNTPQSKNSAELGQKRTRKESKASSYFSGASESVAYATQIMIAQRHYSALATTMVVPPSPGRRTSFEQAIHDAAASASTLATGIDAARLESTRQSQHLRTRSVSSLSGGQMSDPRMDPRFPMSPPPSSPLPPTPPSVRERKARLAQSQHRKSRSQSSASLDLSFGLVGGDDVAEIDALSARVLPLLVPGLKVGTDVRIREDWSSPASTFSRAARRFTESGTVKNGKDVPLDMGGLSSSFSSPEMHSTPPTRQAGLATREKQLSLHKRHHFSLPSLGREGVQALSTWRNDLSRAPNPQQALYLAATTGLESNRRNTVNGHELAVNVPQLNVVKEEDEHPRPTSPPAAAPCAPSQCPASGHTFGPPPPSPSDVPSGVNTARNSLATLITALDQELHMPYSAASDVTLFDLDNMGPQAESTPHESRAHRPSAEQAPSVPRVPGGSSSTRRSSIVYIKSDENMPMPAPAAQKPSAISPKSISEWSSRAVRPLVPKSRKQKKRADGLRPLSLLQDRDVNAASVVDVRAGGKKMQLKVVNDENADPSANASPRQGLKPLKLARSDTTKQRAQLRKQEVLPDVIVRPPSQTQHSGFAYTFRP